MLRAGTYNDFVEENHPCLHRTGVIARSDVWRVFPEEKDRIREGMDGTGYGLNEGPGIDFDDPAAWDERYYFSRSGVHPWEVVRGGNSTHVECGTV